MALRILSLDTASRHTSIAISQDGDISMEYNFTTGGELSSTLLPALKFVLDSSGLNPADIDVYGIGTGPGLFTGIRVGLATLKGILFQQDKPVVPVVNLKALAYKYAHDPATVIPLIDAKREELYIAAYDCSEAGMKEIIPPGIIHINELVQLVKNRPGAGVKDNLTFVGSGAVLCKELLENSFEKSKVLHRSYFLAPEMCKIAYHEHLQGNSFTALNRLMPLYIRKPDAEVNLLRRRDAENRQK